MDKLTVRKSHAWWMGYADGAEAARDSGTAVDPINGWDGDLINAVGAQRAAQLLHCSACGKTWDHALSQYSDGCRAGALAQLGQGPAYVRRLKDQRDTVDASKIPHTSGRRINRSTRLG